jgi:hypothetical protein
MEFAASDDDNDTLRSYSRSALPAKPNLRVEARKSVGRGA